MEKTVRRIERINNIFTMAVIIEVIVIVYLLIL